MADTLITAAPTVRDFGGIDIPYVLTFIAILSMASVFQKARPESKGKNMSKSYFALYDLSQIVINGVILVRLCLLLDQDLFGFRTENTEAIKSTVSLFYYGKYVDLFSTALLLVTHKYDKLNALHLFHHLTVGPVWWYVLSHVEAMQSAAYCFGALVNSFVHLLVYMHFFAKHSNMHTAFFGSKSWKGFLDTLQLGQCVLCCGHALFAVLYADYYKIPMKLAALQLMYTTNAFILYFRDLKFSWSSIGSTVPDAERDDNYHGLRKAKGIFKSGETDGSNKPAWVNDEKLMKRKGFVPQLHIRLHDQVYDCTMFQERHPGGNIISVYHNTDATDAFEAFHGDSDWARRMLKALPIVKNKKPEDFAKSEVADGKSAEKMEDHILIERNPENMTEFHQQIQKEFYGRWQEFALFWVWAGVVVAMIFLAGYLAKECDRPILAGLVIGMAWAHCGFLQHHSGHVAVTGKRSVDFIFQTFFEGLCKGGSARWWRSRHNKHHACPNMIGVDGDLRTTPLFAWDPILAKKCPNWALRIQHVFFIPALALYVPVFFITTKLTMWRKRHWDEIGVLCLHWYFAFAYFTNQFDFITEDQSKIDIVKHNLYNMTILYTIGYCFQGMYLGFFFGLNHFAAERIIDMNTSWARWQSETAANWGVRSWFWAVMSGFLNLQVEHHMFPQLPPFAYPLIQQKVEKYCEKNNMLYRKYGFIEATNWMLTGLYDTGKEELARRMGKKDT